MKRRLLHLVVALMAFASTTMAQNLSVAPIEATPGTETTITVNIAGATEMTALQCNLQLPEGLTLAGDITLGDAAKGHTLSTSTLASGELLIVLYDLYQSTFTDGTLLTIPVVAAEEPSTTEGTLHKVRTSTIAAQSKALSDVKFSAVVGEEPEAKYYWYAGTTDPTTMTSIDPIIPADAAPYVYGWTEITEAPTEIRVFKESSNWQETGLFPEVQWFLACPSEYGFDTSVNGVKVGGWNVTRNAVVIDDVKYDVWKAKSLTDVVNTQLAKVVDSDPEPTPEPEGLSTSKYYRVKNVTTGLYLQVEGNNTNMKLQNKAEGLAMMQIFGLEDAGEGMYYITAADSDNNYYAHASGWNFNATTNADNKTPFTIALVEGETEVYTLHQSVSAYPGLAGADDAAAGAAIYCNKGVDNNGKWAFEPLTEAENAAYVTTLTATAKAALDAAIARGEEVVATRSAMLTAEEVAAISGAVQAAEEAKDAATEVAALKALSDAIHTAVDAAIYVWSIDEVNSEVCYAVSTEDRGAWYAQATHLTSTTKAGVAVDVTDKQQLFAFVQSPETGALYLYSVSEEKFVSAANGMTALTEAPVQTITFLAGTRSAKFPWVVALNAEDGQKQMGISNGYDPAVITHYNDLGDGGNTVRIEKVTTFDATAALAAIKALETGINNSEFIIHNSELIYDLTGRRVEKMEKGIYIVNGKKVIVK